MQNQTQRDRTPHSAAVIASALLWAAVLAGCEATPSVGEKLERRGDEIVIAGQYFHTGAPVVLWTDPGGYDAYRVERRFVPWDQSHWGPEAQEAVGTPNRYGLRGKGNWPPEKLERIRGGGWTLPELREVVDQFVMHYDVTGVSRRTFRVLHDMRGLSVHFMLDIDGTIYQTLDVKERAWHAGKANDRSVGIEIANMGAYPPDEPKVLQEWYEPTDDGRTRITIPPYLGDGGVRTPGFVGYPIRPEPVTGVIQGRDLVQYDLTPQQYDSLVKLTAALQEVLPKIRNDYPRDASGELITRTLTDQEFAEFRGLVGHWHVSDAKIDPGPAFQWNMLIERVAELRDGRRPGAAPKRPRRVGGPRFIAPR